MTGNKILKALYILVLIAFVIFMFRQGKEGGELVYHHGLNVQAVKTLDKKVFDLEEALEEAKSKVPVIESKVVEPVKVEIPAPVKAEVAPAVGAPVQSPLETTGIETIERTPQEPVEMAEKAVIIPDTEEIPTPQ
jgi:hypothetical protein